MEHCKAQQNHEEKKKKKLHVPNKTGHCIAPLKLLALRRCYKAFKATCYLAATVLSVQKY